LLSITVYAEDNITTFTEDWTFSLSANYNLGLLTQSDASQFRTNKPWNIGIGIRYKIFSIKTSFSIPVTDSSVVKPSVSKPSFDFEVASYYNRVYFGTYFKYYRDYYVADTDEPVGLDTLSLGFTTTFVQNYKNHSLSSVNLLNKRQNISSGSFLYSLGAFYSSLYSSSEMISDFIEKQNIIYFGQGIGYSYIWAFKSGLFINASLVLFTNAGFNIITNKWLFIPHLEPNFVIGYHQNTWSVNLRIMNKTTVFLKESSFFVSPDEWDYNLLSLITTTLMFSKRF
jgi:hypothetical protein